LSDYAIGHTIGKGSYAIVKVATERLTTKKVAIKTYDKIKLLDPQKKKNLDREISILQRLNHENIVKLYKTIHSNR